MATYTSMANAIKSVMEKYSKQFVPILDPEKKTIKDETPTEHPADQATDAGDRTNDYPQDEHHRLKDVVSGREKIKADLKRAMRVQHKVKIIDDD